MKSFARWLLFCVVCLVAPSAWAAGTPGEVRMPADVLRDKIRGGLLGQMLGNLNGLPHEFKYIEEPGNVSGYVPALPEGAWTDDDTDFEWVYVIEMQQQNRIMLPPDAITEVWTKWINRRIWCANQYARQLMSLGLEPPLTGQPALNPWASFNISGQFICETFGLLAPAMPQTAAKIGVNYTTVAINGEPAQTTQLFTTMIATAFVEDDINRIIDAGVKALDPNSEMNVIIADVRRWHAENPDDWRATRAAIKEKYIRHGTTLRDTNGHELNGAATIAALLYGGGDLPKTLETAFNFGWDADNNAATSGTIVGVTMGHRAMLAKGWKIVDRYKNTNRDGMPTDETITSFADRLIELAEKSIVENGGRIEMENGRPVVVIRTQTPANVLPLASAEDEVDALREDLRDDIERDILRGADETARARGAYLAICLDLTEEYSKNHPEEWSAAIAALNEQWRISEVLFYQSKIPSGQALQEKAIAAGFKKPSKHRPLWPGAF